MVANLNDKEWYKQYIKLNIDRVSLLNLVGLMELALRHPDLPERVKKTGIKTGRAFASVLIDDGLILPDEVQRSWEKSFQLPHVINLGLIIEGLTNQEGRPWK